MTIDERAAALMLSVVLAAGCSSSDSGVPANGAQGGQTSAQGGSIARGGDAASTTGGSGNGGEVGASSGGRASTGGDAGAGMAARAGNTGSAGAGGRRAGGGGRNAAGEESGGGGQRATAGTAAGGRSASGGRDNSAGHSSGGASAGSAGANAGSAGASAGSAGASGGATAMSCTSSDTAYHVIWSDEFDGAAGAIDATKWVFDVGGNGGGNNELEYYSDGTNNAALDGNGHLVITAKKETHGANDYTSARITTLGRASWTYGRIEARIQIPKGQGIWPAFWMLGTSCTGYPVAGWPGCGEIDVMENIGNTADQNLVHGTIHGPGYSAAAGPTKTITLSAPVSADFHVFAIEWEKDAIRWYVDTQLYSTKTPADIPSDATWVYNAPFYLLLNVAVGGDWPGAPDASTTFPQSMLVDYVRVCQK